MTYPYNSAPPHPTPPPPPPPAPPKRTSTGVILAICGAVLAPFVFVVLIGAATVLFSSPKSTTTRPSTATPTTITTTTTAAPTATINAMPAFGARVAPLLSALQGDMQGITSAANRMDISGLRAVCRSLDTDTSRMRAALPSPDPELTAELNLALDDFETSAAACIRGATTLDSTDLRTAGVRISSGGEHMAAAGRILDRY